MKKTVNVNISGMPFTLDDDACKMLETYFNSLRDVLRHQPCDTNEVINDIENRCAEILSLQYGANAIITVAMVESLIEQMGDAEDILEIGVDTRGDKEHISIDETTVPPPPPISTQPIPRKLYRSEDDKMIGGVCGGLAAYFNIDSTWLRLGVVALTFLSVSTVALVYLHTFMDNTSCSCNAISENAT